MTDYCTECQVCGVSLTPEQVANAAQVCDDCEVESVVVAHCHCCGNQLLDTAIRSVERQTVVTCDRCGADVLLNVN